MTPVGLKLQCSNPSGLSMEEGLYDLTCLLSNREQLSSSLLFPLRSRRLVAFIF